MEAYLGNKYSHLCSHHFPRPHENEIRLRSGVQLKDKWRNLIKFNHISPADFCFATITTTNAAATGSPWTITALSFAELSGGGYALLSGNACARSRCSSNQG